MKLVRYGKPGKEKPGVIDAKGKLRDCSHVVPDFVGEYVSPKHLKKVAKALKNDELKAVSGTPRIGACVGRPVNFIAVGLNYADHAAESNMPIPSEPILFNKAPNCIVGPNDDVVIPKGSQKCDWEVELGIVIGKQASYISEDEAMDHVAGFCLANDVSEREFQLVTTDEVKDVQNLGMWLDVNGERMQTGSTKTMIFGVRKIVSYISQFMTLEPGDVIVTGTPPGVGAGKKPPRFLRSGDTMRLGIEGLGEQACRVLAYGETD